MQQRCIQRAPQDLFDASLFLLLAPPALGREHPGQAIEELAAPWQQRTFDPRKRPLRIVLQRRSRQRLEHRPAEIQRAEFQQAQAAVFESTERP